MMENPNDRVASIQEALSSAGIPGWLFYGFHANDPIALSVLGFGPGYHATRRWFYLIPARGEPAKLVHRIESSALEHLPGQKLIYLRWHELRSQMQSLLAPLGRVAMQYSAENAVPYVSRVDAGTVELVRSVGAEVVSSADLVQLFDVKWRPEQASQHRGTARLLTTIVREAFERAASEISKHGASSELSIQNFIGERFEQNGLITDSPAIVAVNRHSGDPHYAPSETSNSPIRRGDFLLIDLWAKPNKADAVYADITWTAFFGGTPPESIQRVFGVVRDARDAGVRFLQETVSGGVLPEGWQVDDEVRRVIREAGYEQNFLHRTGHNLGREVHGNGVNFDNLETHDTRTFLPGLACTIEPGIYLEEFGVRNEIDVYFAPGGPEVTTPSEDALLVFDL